MPPKIETDTQQAMQEIGEQVEQRTGKGYGFLVIVFPFSLEGTDAHYVSNVKPEDAIHSLRETANRLEAKEDVSPSCQLPS